MRVTRRGEIKEGRVHDFKVGEYVLITYPVRAPNKLSPIYRGPLIIVEKIRDEIYVFGSDFEKFAIDPHVASTVFSKSDPNTEKYHHEFSPR